MLQTAVKKLLKVPLVNKYLLWIDRNKEGAMIGAAWGLLLYLSGNTFTFIYDPLINLLKPASNLQFALYLVNIGLVAGAIVDSIWKPKR